MHTECTEALRTSSIAALVRSSDSGQRPLTTHEWGHTFGLDHVSEDTHPTMTMSTNSSYCDTSARTLGRGDALGMYSIY